MWLGTTINQKITVLNKLISISFSPHTIALTRETKLWEDTRSCYRHSAVNSGKGEMGTEKTKDNILTKNLKRCFLHYSETLTLISSYVHLIVIYTAISKLSGFTIGDTKSEATLGNTLSKIVRDALASDRCIYLIATSPLFQPKYWATSSWEQPRSLRVLDNPTRKLCGVSPA